MGAFIGRPQRRAMIRTGTYQGDGLDDRDIDIGVDLAAKANVCIIIKGQDTNQGIWRIEYGQGDLTMFFGTTTDGPDYIQGLTSTGFQVGAGVNANGNGITFRYAVFWQES